MDTRGINRKMQYFRIISSLPLWAASIWRIKPIVQRMVAYTFRPDENAKRPTQCLKFQQKCLWHVKQLFVLMKVRTTLWDHTPSTLVVLEIPLKFAIFAMPVEITLKGGWFNKLLDSKMKPLTVLHKMEQGCQVGGNYTLTSLPGKNGAKSVISRICYCWPLSPRNWSRFSKLLWDYSDNEFVTPLSTHQKYSLLLLGRASFRLEACWGWCAIDSLDEAAHEKRTKTRCA